MTKIFKVKLTRWFAFCFFTMQVHSVAFSADIFDSIRPEVAKGNREKAILLLKEAIEKKQFTGEDRSLSHFTIGVLYYQSGNLEEASKHLQESLKQGSKLTDHIHLFLGRYNKTMGKYDEAHTHLRQIRTAWGSRKNFNDARFEMGLLAVLEKDWHQARMHFNYLSHKMRGTEFYPQILWNLVLAEAKLRKPWQACKWARKLYAKYPTHPLVYDWGVDLHTAKVSGETLGCYATVSDIKSRFKNLQWAGDPDRARAEMETLRQRSTPKTQYYVDNMFAEFLVDEGLIEEAMPILVKYFDEKKDNVDYLMLLAKAAARAQKYQLAASSYHHAYEMNPNSKKGRTALFRAAFLSYQFQDYDGAARKFLMIQDKFRKSGLVRDAQWHLAWIRYLKGDYDGAYKSFAQLKGLIRKAPRVWRSIPQEKVQYWMAMSSLKAGRVAAARTLFENLVKRNDTNYYAILSKNRLNEIPKGGEEIRLPAAESSADGGVPVAANESAAPGDLQSEEESTVTEEEESEQTVTNDQAEETEEEAEVADDDTPPTEAEEDAKDMMTTMSFGNPEFMRKYQRAQDLIRIGFYDWAKWELFDIEGRIRDPKKLRMLISQYQAIETFNRAAYVGFVVLAPERIRRGFDGAKELWEAAYPQAYVNPVKQAANDFAVPQHFVWSIIRAESQYKPDAKSPTGARGLMQVMPFTAKQVAKILKDDGFLVDQLFEPQVNIRIGTRYLGKLVKKFSGQLPLVAAAYNAGPHRVDGWLGSFGSLDMDEFVEHIPFVETRDYVKRVVSNLYTYDYLYNGKETPMKWAIAPVSFKGDMLSAYRERWEE